MSDPMVENLIQFTHLDKLYGYLPGMAEAQPATLASRMARTFRSGISSPPCIGSARATSADPAITT